MRKFSLQVEHKFKSRLIGLHIVKDRGQITTVGSAKTADIQIPGEDVAGLHAAFERSEDGWLLMDLGSESGTWVEKKPVMEMRLDGPTHIQIGGHQLTVVPHSFERQLFAKETAPPEGANLYHQVVVLKNDFLFHTVLLEPTAEFTPAIPQGQTFSAPKSKDWVEHKIGVYTIKQRLTQADHLKDSLSDTFGEDWRRPAPIVAALLTLFFVVGLMLMAPTKSADEMKTLTPDMQNQYTRMIYDGKKVRSQKAIAEKLRKNMAGQSTTGVAKTTPGGDAGAKAAGGAKAPPGARVVVNLQKSGLGALIGKVAARAGKNAQLVQAAGVAADSPTSGRALGLGGGSSMDKLGGGGGGGTGNQTMKVGGLGTAGKGGGSTGYKGTGALSLGNIGNAEVGALEEESEVDGGLDKEAIARVIRAQLGQIRYCYERQLSANPDLYGKILVKFTIGSAGSVVAQTIGTTSLKNAMVEGCILRRVAGWQFPTPKGGTNVLVTYPFLFKSTR